jgi:hypothetical protein
VSNPHSAVQAFARNQFASASFDYHRLTDEFAERVLKECRVRHVTPLVKQPGILAITDKGLYFQPLHNISGGSAVQFHPVEAITSLARRTAAMRPVALEVFMMPSTSDAMHYVRADQVPHPCVSSCLL